MHVVRENVKQGLSASSTSRPHGWLLTSSPKLLPLPAFSAHCDSLGGRVLVAKRGVLPLLQLGHLVPSNCSCALKRSSAKWMSHVCTGVSRQGCGIGSMEGVNSIGGNWLLQVASVGNMGNSVSETILDVDGADPPMSRG